MLTRMEMRRIPVPRLCARFLFHAHIFASGAFSLVHLPYFISHGVRYSHLLLTLLATSVLFIVLM